MKTKPNQTLKVKKKCNKNWHVFNELDKPCECGEINSFEEYVKQMKETR